MDDLLVEVVQAAHPDLRERYGRLAQAVAEMMAPGERIRAACVGAVDVEAIPVVMAATTRRLVGVGPRRWVMNAPYSAVDAVGRGEGRTRTNDVGALVVSGVRIRTASPAGILQRFLAATRQGIAEDAAGIWPDLARQRLASGPIRPTPCPRWLPRHTPSGSIQGRSRR